ncbi:MAG: hypothetical protein ACREPE_00805, partial [Lysobacter sp.]
MKNQLALALALAAAPFAASASDLSYTFIEAGYTESTVDLGSLPGFGRLELEMDGFAVDGSLAFNDKFYGAFGYRKVEIDGDNAFEPAELTLGFNQAIGAKADFIAEASYIGANSEIGGEDFHNDGYRVAAGVRAAITNHLELGAKATHSKIENMESVTGVNVNGQIKFNQTWGIVAEYHYNELNFFGDVDTWQIGVRASFYFR